MTDKELRSAIMTQARSDDKLRNKGWMFGKVAQQFFSDGGQYRERWDCTDIGMGGGGILRRRSTHPQQAIRYYIYIPSSAYGGIGDRPTYRLIMPKVTA